ncbi:hypothetical protein QYE76_051054 [Lolium multiflorum]|uniref:Transposase-associated domain-containing protein n=1 Tax=Lolium multiflorum TaxID=4521 RepID=A0AAD8SSN7_LOLMU|nr:hypothetical protein QYE76_051054 [Lolium multiflorum]
MAIDDVNKDGTASAEASAPTAREVALEEQVKKQGNALNQLTTKLDTFIELMMNKTNNTTNNGAPSPSSPHRVVDPQEKELQDGAIAATQLNDGRQLQEPNTHARQWASPAGASNEAPQPSVLKGYHDFIEDMVTKREGVNSFLLVAEANKSKQGFMCCPCLKCKNEKDYSCSRDIKSHLLRFGFMSSYNVWTKHGEEGVMMEDGDEEEDNDDQYRSMFSECNDTAMDDNEEEGGEEQASDDPTMIFVGPFLMQEETWHG